MRSRLWSATGYALGLGLRAAAIGGLAFAAAEVALRGRLYATALLLAAGAVLIGADLVRAILAADRALETFLSGIGAGVAERPTRRLAGFPSAAAAMQRAADALDETREARQRRVDALEALLNAVTVALLVVGPDGVVALANRAARALAGSAVAKLDDIAALGPAAAGELARLRPGARQIVRLADGRRMLAFALQFAAGDGPPRRLISLQSLSGELDAVEQQAWRDLVRILAHEMMNSLTPIASLAESLSKMVVAPIAGVDTTRELASAIEVIGRRSEGLMNFVERYRRVAELPEPQVRAIPLAPFIADLEQLMAGAVAETGAAWRSEVSPRTLTVNADPELLQQAMINLIKNALDAAAGAPAPCITVSCLRDEDGIVLRVADTGRGPPPGDPEQVFLPFYTTKAGGSGIGLTLARQIALAHRGRLTMSANVPQGAVFSLTLPGQ